MRYLMIDRVLAFEADRRVVATKCVTRESDVMEHHFPGFPLFPGALTLEAMAQAAGYLLIRSARELRGGDLVTALASVDWARFNRPVLPGDRLTLTARLEERLPNAARVSVRAEADGQGAAAARLLLVCRPLDWAAAPEAARFLDQLLATLDGRSPWP